MSDIGRSLGTLSIVICLVGISFQIGSLRRAINDTSLCSAALAVLEPRK